MTEPSNRRIVLASRPEGEPTRDHFRLETSPIPEPGPGQILIRILSFSPVLKVTAPESMVSQIRERLDRQMAMLAQE